MGKSVSFNYGGRKCTGILEQVLYDSANEKAIYIVSFEGEFLQLLGYEIRLTKW